MEQADIKEIFIAIVIFILFIAFILVRKLCSTIAGSCETGWVVYGVLLIMAVIFLKVKVFK
jgi:hypothetical protein